MNVSDDRGEGLTPERLLGVVWNAWSRRPFDIVVYDDGLLLVRGQVADVARQILASTPTAWRHGRRTLVERSQEVRLAELRATRRPALLAANPDATFLAAGQITEVQLHVAAGLVCWMSVTTTAVGRRTFVWTPTMNYPDAVQDVLRSVFGDRLRA